jgi:hypothetical protein
MLKPNPGMLLARLRTSLKEQVLPELDDAAASKQLKASLHLIGRLEKSWDLYAQHVASDNADIEKSLTIVLQKLTDAGAEASAVANLQDALKRVGFGGADIPGLNDPALISASRRNLALQGLLIQVEDLLDCLSDSPELVSECRSGLARLYRRMTERDSVYVGDQPLVSREELEP